VKELEFVGGRTRVLGNDFEGVNGLGAGLCGAGLGTLVVDLCDGGEMGLAGGVHEDHDELAECHACLVRGFLGREGGGEEVAKDGGLVGGERWETARCFHEGRVEGWWAASSVDGRMFAKLRAGVVDKSKILVVLDGLGGESRVRRRRRLAAPEQNSSLGGRRT
jgi:hypothetical protein